MSLNKQSAINYNNACNYSQKAIGIIQMFVRAGTVGYFDNQTVEKVYQMQQSPLYGFAPGSADGMVGPSTLGVMIMELEHVSRMIEAAVLKSYCYKINGEIKNPEKKPQVYTPPKSSNAPAETPKTEEKINPKDKDKPAEVYPYELKQIRTSGSIVHGNGSIMIGNLYLATTDIRLVLGGGGGQVYYIVIQTESKALDPFFVGKVYRQTTLGFHHDTNQNAAYKQVYRSGKGGMEMAKKEVELLMGAICSGVGAFGGVAALTAGAMNILFMNSEEIFKAANGIEELMKVKNVLATHTPEFWQLCKTVLRLAAAKTPEAMWSDPYGSIRLAGELVMIVGEAVLLKKVRSLGTIAKIAGKLMTGLFSKLADAATLALDQKNLAAAIKEADPTLDQIRIDRIIKELKDNWKVVEPALKTLKAVADQLVGA